MFDTVIPPSQYASLRLDGNSEHVSHAARKIGIF